jgi:hypothetical protein
MLPGRIIRHKRNGLTRVREKQRKLFSPTFSSRFCASEKNPAQIPAGLCFWHGVSSFQDVAALAVASLDLEVVRLIRGAIRAADIEGGKLGGGEFVPTTNIQPRPQLHPEPRILPRQVIHPTPRYEPRPVIHPTPRQELPAMPPPAPEPSEHLQKLPPPPWKQLVWQIPVPSPATIKVVRYKTDIPHKGLLLDTFI